MKTMKVGAVIVGPPTPGQQVSLDARATIEGIAFAEEVGLDAVWLGLISSVPDTLTILAAAAMKTTRIELGTSIYPIFLRHPVAMAQMAKTIDQLAPGRFRLGVGTSHRSMVEDDLGIPFVRPLEYLREYVTVLRALLCHGEVDFTGKRVEAHVSFDGPSDVQVLASALGAKTFEFCGELTDGAIAGVCPLSYIDTVARPALLAGAAKAERPAPTLLVHMAVAVSTDQAVVVEAARRQFEPRLALPFYARMLSDAGFPEANDGIFSPRMVETLVVHGDAETVKSRLRELERDGVEELRAVVLQPEADPGTYLRTLETLGELARES
jgi:alkanesulfonate monooxygenase SsuD/methylene tetrahydromethanopterin reductase-like flavin-dependent oxidoreductase (luciferase family)